MMPVCILGAKYCQLNECMGWYRCTCSLRFPLLYYVQQTLHTVAMAQAPSASAGAPASLPDLVLINQHRAVIPVPLSSERERQEEERRRLIFGPDMSQHIFGGSPDIANFMNHHVPNPREIPTPVVYGLARDAQTLTQFCQAYMLQIISIRRYLAYKDVTQQSYADSQRIRFYTLVAIDNVYGTRFTDVDGEHQKLKQLDATLVNIPHSRHFKNLCRIRNANGYMALVNSPCDFEVAAYVEVFYWSYIYPWT